MLKSTGISKSGFCSGTRIMSDIQHSDEIDLLQLIETLWEGKGKIIAITSACVLGMFGFQLLAPPPSFVATTEIKPISSKEADQYALLNSLEFYTIDRETLLSLFNERLTQPETLERVLGELELLDQKDYDSQSDYNVALRALAAKLELLPPLNPEGTERGESRRHWTLTFEYNNKDKWLATLQTLKGVATNEVQDIIKDRFTTLLASSQLKRDYQLEDFNIQIENILNDYERKTSDRLAFLSEQAAIARELSIAKNTIEAQTFSAQNSVLTNVKTDTPFYLRGYEAIEKEIELIKTRQDKRAFVSGLLELEQEKRALEQDKTLERVEQLFANTPVMTPGAFRAATLTVDATQFDTKSSRMLMLALAAVVGGMIGVVYVLIASATRGRREAEAG